MELLDKGYDLVERDDLKDHWAIRITKGKYAGVEFSYGQVSVKEIEEGEDGNATLTFDYHVYEFTEAFTQEMLEESTEFQTNLGDILTDIIMESIEEKKKSGSEFGNEHTSESTDQRAVRSSGYTISEG
jgi:hypothetical protein